MTRASVGVVLLTLVSAPALAAEGAGQKPNLLSAAELKEGWKLLFDGRTTRGWAPRSNPPPPTAAGVTRAAAPPATEKPVKWTAQGGELFASSDGGKGPLATNEAYRDFVLRLEFWIDEGSNSGVFIRAPQSGSINQNNSLEVNLFDGHPDWPTGSINGVQRTSRTPRTVGRWNTLEITARGEQLIVVLNSEKVVEAKARRLAEGSIAFQYASGIKFRAVRIKPL